MAGSKTRTRPSQQKRPASQQKRPAARPPRNAAAAPAAAPESPGPPAWLRWVMLILALAGLAVSIYLTYAHFTESSLAGCSETGAINCGKVTTSPQSFVFGIPVAVLGLAFYVFLVAIMSPWAWRWNRREVGLVRLLSLVVGIGFVLYLVYAEVFDIGSICLYCTSVHIITLVLFALVAISAAIWGLSPAARPTGPTGPTGPARPARRR
jgi:uncharacterized membrane protein